MAVVYDHSCLMSVLRNTSGAEMFFGFIPAHGKRLAAAEEISVFGNILEAINRGDRFGNRHMNALLDALDRGDITIVSTPAPILFDETNQTSHILQIDGGNVEIADVCWETSLSESA